MNDPRNLILTIILSMGILLGWQYFFEAPRIEEAKQRAEKYQQEQIQLEEQKNIEVQQREGTILDRSEAIAKDQRIPIMTDKLSGSISLRGARFDDLRLLNYREEQDPASPNITLLSPGRTKSMYFTEFGWISSNRNLALPNADTIWQTDGNALTDTHPVTLFWENGQGLEFRIKIAVDENYMFQVTQTVTNQMGQSISLLPYGRIKRTYDNPTESFFILHEGALGVFDDILSEYRYSDLKDEGHKEFRDTKGWLGITDKYWLTALVPDRNHTFTANYRYQQAGTSDRYQVDYLLEKETIASNETYAVNHHFFAGAKQLSLLDTYSQKLDITLFDRAVDFGWFYFLTKPIFVALNYFNSVVGNFGIAIIILTIVIKILMYPLAQKSYFSMNQMKQLQPDLVRLRDQYANDKMTLNKEMMALYKRHKVNPLAGCLPLFIQIPVFFSLYKVLFVTLEMRHAPFYGWVKDLSARDPTTIVNLFGLIPWDPPQFLMIGIWPLLMTASMVIQQKLNPAPADPVQAKVMKMLPYFFLFIFAGFPAGLVIYWTVNNVLSILQQWLLLKKMKKIDMAKA